MKKLGLFILVAAGVSGCATYPYAENIKMVGFTDDGQKGTSVGNIHGEDCAWSVFGKKLGSDPTVDRAFENAKNQAGFLESAGLDDSAKKKGAALRYVNNVTTKTDGFNAGVVAKQCIVVTGVGFR